MHSSSKKAIKKLSLMSLLITIALILGYFERFLPVVGIPGVKLGLANIVSLVALVILPFKDSLVIVIVRVIMLSFFGGNAMSFLYSLCGGVASLLAMELLLRISQKKLSLIGISVFGAFIHNTAQMAVLGIMMRSFFVALNYYPILIIAAVIAGILTGFISVIFFSHSNRIELFETTRFDIT